MQYKICPKCGAHLDFGERCDDCREKRKEAAPAATGNDLRHQNTYGDYISIQTKKQGGDF